VPFEIYSGYQKHLNTVLPGHDDIITCLCIVSLSKLASGCGDGQIKMWDIDSQMCVGKLLGHIGEVWDLVPITD
jgi:WD40 repeat protein